MRKQMVQKIKVMEKLFENGCCTEKDLQGMGIEKLLKISGITIADMSVILDLQKQTKAGRLFTYLSEGYGAAEYVKKPEETTDKMEAEDQRGRFWQQEGEQEW